MARTKQTACSWPRATPVFGSWTINRWGGWQTTKHFWDHIDLNDANVIVVPSHFALNSAPLRSRGGEQKVVSLAAGTERTHENVVRQPTCLLELPAEILVQIFRLLLPEGEVYHFSPTVKNTIPAISVHRLVPSETDDVGLPRDRLRFLPAASLICRHLMDIAYTVFFRDNQFVFEIATVGLTSVVRRAQTDIRSYSTFICTTPRGLAPLGPIGAKYLTRLTLSITLTSIIPTRHHGNKLQDSVQRIASFLEGSASNLKSLTVDLQFGKGASDRVMTHKLEVSSSHGLRMYIRNIDSQSLKKSNSTKAQTLQHTERLAELVAPLMWLGVEDVQISGLLTAEDIRAYKEASLKDGKRICEGATIGPPTKRQRFL